METIVVWLLMNIGTAAPNGQATSVLATFADHGECQRVALVVSEARETNKPLLRCVEARVLRP